MSDDEKNTPASAAWQDVTPIEAMDDGGYVYFLYNAKKVDTARAADAQQIANQVVIITDFSQQLVERDQQIAALRAENARLFNLLDFKDPDVDPAATMTPDEMRELQASFDAFVAARQERAAKLADYDRLKEQLTALQAEADRWKTSSDSWWKLLKIAEAERDALQAEHQRHYQDWQETAQGLQKQLVSAQQQVKALQAEQAQWQTWGIIEIAVRNVNVASYMNHWEGRALKAEAALAALTAQQEKPVE